MVNKSPEFLQELTTITTGRAIALKGKKALAIKKKGRAETRKLAHDDERVHKSRECWAHELGWYYIRNYRYNIVTYTHVDLESLGRELGVLANGEEAVG